MPTSDAVAFLQKWRPGGPWVLTSITTDRKSIDTATFEADTTDELEGVAEWIDGFNGKRNLYFHVNPCLRPMGKKAQREDIASLDWLHVDIDPRVGEDVQQEQERALGLVTDNLPEGVPAPTCVIFSGGGYQAFWKLDEPQPIDGQLEKAEDLKRYNLQLEVLFGGDNCHNVDRIMRLPGTMNIPDAKKRKKGRTEVEARLVSFTDTAYPLSDFSPATLRQTDGGSYGEAEVKVSGNVARLTGVEDLEEWGVPDRVKVVIVQGSHPDETKEGDNSRSAWLFDVCCNLVRCGVPDEVIYSVITDPDFGISESVIDKGSNAEKYALRQIGQAKEFAIDPKLVEFNNRYAVIGNIGGKCRIVEEQEDMVLGRTKLTMQSFGDFQNRHLHQTVEVPGQNGPRSIPAGKWWLHNPKRRQYDRIIFSPGGDRPGAYNLWRGFACDARPGDCSKYLEHIKANLCNDIEGHYDYLIGWMAMLVQHPDRAGQVAVVLRGDQGTGKSFFAKVLGSLFGRHYMQISDPKHLVGSFNAHMRDAVLVFGDEAFFAGDKKHESVLKTLITEDTITIEAKGYDAEVYPNYVHVILASNSQWVIPAGANERRFFVVDVSDEHRQDGTYFGDIMQQMNAGGREALLHYLMTYGLEDFDVRQFPKTEALKSQRLLSFDPHQAWWYDKLWHGTLIGEQQWAARVYKVDLQEDYVSRMQEERVFRPMARTSLGHFLKEVCPAIEPVQSGKPYRDSKRPYLYILPSLQEAREAWDAAQGTVTDWPVVDLSDVAEEGEDEPF